MLIVILFIATVLLVIWTVLMSLSAKEDWIGAAYNKVLDNILIIDKLRLKDIENAQKLSQYHGVMSALMKPLLGGNSEYKITVLEYKNSRIQGGDFKKLGVFVIPGYVLLRKLPSMTRSGVHKTIISTTLELFGKKHAEYKAMHLMAKLCSYLLVGVALSLIIGTVIMGLGSLTAGLIVLCIGTGIVIVLVYAMYDDISDKATKRRESISRQFPNMVSKLALLVTSGMIMDRAWKETAYSQDLQLYREMQKTSEELDNLVSPEEAYGAFITRCNTKETAKLASAIMQNLSKGNAEIGRLLKDMAKEAWLERRHTAKRDSEKANSKLMIPTMLLFLTILVILMVPVVMNFSSL